MRHLESDLLHAALAGDVPVKLLLRQLLAHVEELCPECRDAAVELKRGLEESDRATPAADSANPGNGAVVRFADPCSVAVLDRVEVEARDWAQRVRRERRKARADVRQLVRLPAEARAERIERAHSRFRSRAVAELLLEESRRLVHERPAEARSLAGLVDLVLLWTPGALGQDWARDLGVRAQAWIANTLRVEVELRAAERAFAEARSRMAREVVGDEVHAEVASLEASLRLDQGRVGEARRLLDLAAVVYRAEGNDQALAGVLTKRAMVEYLSDDMEAAVTLQRQVLAAFAGTPSDRRSLGAVVNLGIMLVDGGRVSEADELLGREEARLRGAGAWEWPEARVLRGRIRLAQGALGEAEGLFLAAREELVESGASVRAAIASLDLAVLYLEQGRTSDLRRTARLIGTVFESAELESEALAAVVLFQQAVAAESVSATAVRAWRRQLEIAKARGRLQHRVQ